MTIDIILPIYNPDKNVFLAIDNIIEQTYKDWHLTIIDDASNNNMPKRIIRKCQAYSNQISYIKLQKNIKAAAARNYAISKSKAKYIAFLDQDDIWMKDKLEKQFNYFKTYPNVDAIHGNIEFINEDNKILEGFADLENNKRADILWEDTGTALNNEIFIMNPIRLISSIMKRSCFINIGGFDEKLFGGEDWEFWLRFSNKFEIAYIPEILIYRRIHSKNVSKVYKSSRCFGKLTALKKIRKENYGITNKNIKQKEYFIYSDVIQSLKTQGNFRSILKYLIEFGKIQPFSVFRLLKLLYYSIFTKKQ